MRRDRLTDPGPRRLLWAVVFLACLAVGSVLTDGSTYRTVVAVLLLVFAVVALILERGRRPPPT